ncbi:MAG: hypothetical protein IPN08_04160 [Bacteroidales bacterium]|nr:hypothetical protein [Bacteroidales bacterium]
MIRFDRSVSGSPFHQFLVLLTVFVTLYLFWLILAYLIYGCNFALNREIPDLGWSIIAQMIDPGNQHMVGSEAVAIDWRLRLFALLLTLSGTFAFGGLLISTITNIFEQRVAIVREGLVSYRFTGHIVVLGFHDITPGIMIQLLANHGTQAKKFVILTEKNVSEVRKILESGFTKRQLKRVYILAGDRTSSIDLLRAGVRTTETIYIPGESGESDHDPRNNACLKEISRIVRNSPAKTKTKLLCHVLFDSQSTHLLYQYGNIDLSNEKNNGHTITINSFSFCEYWAKKVFTDDQDNPDAYSVPDFEPVSSDSDKYVHLIVAGMTRMGFALAVQAARLGHLANHQKRKTRITLIDSNADRESNYFASRYQSFFDAVDVESINLFTGEINHKRGSLPFINIELRFVKGHFESPAIRQKLLDWTSDTDALTTLAIAFNDPGASMAAGLYLPEEIYGRNTRILIRQNSVHSGVSLLIPDGKTTNNKFRNVKVFGMLDNCPGLVGENSYKAMMVNYFYYSGNQMPGKFTEDLFESILQNWEKLEERHKWSSRHNAESIPVKLRTVGSAGYEEDILKKGFSEEIINKLAEIEHTRWNVDTLLSGYSPAPEEIQEESIRTADLIWKAMKDNEGDFEAEEVKRLKKQHEEYMNGWKRQMIHPCIMPFENLSEYYRETDRRLSKSIPVIESEYSRLVSLKQTI